MQQSKQIPVQPGQKPTTDPKDKQNQDDPKTSRNMGQNPDKNAQEKQQDPRQQQSSQKDQGCGCG